ncbi:uncharacterized protein LOC112561509 [Pomacea canaliculata]|uniref:uncharacterized protein LOC112561509 n=1 Tax=Pomacea canaliculata TaxID=400727 RepID=UPI000D734411|nr:uncharacterized protein LOC112561509 [Pomacea canaliculata]
MAQHDDTALRKQTTVILFSSEQPCLTPTVSPATCTTRHPAVATRLQPLFASRVQQNVCRALLPVIIYIVFMIVLGTVGNSVALVVYYKRFKPSSTRTFIMSLSAISLLASLVCFPEKIAEYCLHFTFTNRSACQVFSFLRGFTTYSMGLTHTAMAFDRQRRVCSPSVRQWKMQDIYIAVGMCVALSVFISIPMYVLYGSRTVDWTSNVTGVMCGEDDSYVRTTGLILYYVVLKGVFVTGMVVIVISYVKVGLKVWEHKKQLEKRYLATSSCRHQARDRDRESFQVPAMSQLEVTRTDNNITHGDRCSTSCDLDCTGRNLTSFEINSTFSCGDRAECHVTGKLYDVTSFDHVVPNPPCDCLKLVTFTPPSVAHSSALSQPSRRTLRYLCSMNPRNKPCTTASDIQPTNPASHATVTSQYVGVGLEEMSEGGCEEISLHPEVNRGLSEKSMSTEMLNLIQFCLLSHYINFTIGPIVYSVCSVRFRQQLCYFLSGLFVYIVVLMITGLLGNSLAVVVYSKRFKGSSTRTMTLGLSVAGLAANLVCFPQKLAELSLQQAFNFKGECEDYSKPRGPTASDVTAQVEELCCDAIAPEVVVTTEVQSTTAATEMASEPLGDNSALAVTVGGVPDHTNRLWVDTVRWAAWQGGARCIQAVSSMLSPFVQRNSTVTAAMSEEPDMVPPHGGYDRRPRRDAILSRTTKMLFVVTVIFAFSYLPRLIIIGMHLSRSHGHGQGQGHGHDAHALSLTQLNVHFVFLYSNFISFTVNPIVYSVLSATFRRDCRRLLLDLRRKYEAKQRGAETCSSASCDL